MGLSSSVFAVFAVDLGELPGSFWSALYEAAEVAARGRALLDEVTAKFRARKGAGE